MRFYPPIPASFHSKAEMVRYYRQRARVDLVFLCNVLLNYPDVSWKYHQRMIESLQQFYGGFDIKIGRAHV